MGAAILLLLLAGCTPPFGKLLRTGPLELPIAQESITIAWDHTSGRLTSAEHEVVKYRLYYRRHGTRGWILYTEVSANGDPMFTIRANRLLERQQTERFDFGVSSITRAGVESAIHSSTDFAAWPHGGWYVTWTRP